MVVVDSVALLPDSMINLGSCCVVCESDGWGVVDVLFRWVSLQYIFQTAEMYGIVIFRMERYAVFRLGDMEWCVLRKSWVNSPRRHRWSGSGWWMQVEIMLRSSFWVSRSGDHDGE